MTRMGRAAVSEGARARPWLARPEVAVTLAGWVVGLVVTALILWSPYLKSGFRSPSLHVMLDTADACIALLVAYLVHARFVRRRYWQDRFLAQGLVLLAVASFGLSSLAGRLPGVQAGTLDIWLPLTVRVAGALCILVAALAEGRPVRRVFAQRHAWLLPLVLIVVVSSGLWIARSDLPVAFDTASIPSSAEHPLLTGHPALLIGQALAALCFFVASIAFASQSPAATTSCSAGSVRRSPSRRSRGSTICSSPRCTPTGCTPATCCAPVATCCCSSGPAGSSGSTGRRSRGPRCSRTDAGWPESCTTGLSRARLYPLRKLRPPADLPAADRIIAACDRGLDEARAAVQALGRPTDEPLGFVLHRAARELAERYQVNLEVEVDDSISVQTDQQHALMRITREAVSNAVRHGKAPRIHVQLAQSDGQRRLVVQDDGQGFDPDRAVADNAGYGLVSMRDRARSLPGSLAIDSNPGSGSVVTVTW
jgi:hypothetical protein